MNNKIALPEYSERLFVNRRSETALVLDKAQRLLSGQPVSERTVTFMGERGTGKSWLLKHLRTQLSEMPGVVPCVLDLAAYERWNSLVAVTAILQDLARRLKVKLRAGDPSQMSRRFLERVNKRLDDQVLVLLVDHVYESDWDLLDALEEYVLGPLAAEAQTLIVLAGRGRPYPFKTPELRFGAEFVDLDLFSESDTQAQLERQQRRSISQTSQVYFLSQGNPLANYLLALKADPEEALNEVIDEMLKSIEDPGQRRKVREYLEALSVLQVFDEARIPHMLAAYYNDPKYRDWSHAQAREVRESLVDAGFARWDAQEGGYVLDKLIRWLVERYMKNNEAPTWERLQCAAVKLYETWARTYQRTQERWRQAYEYHHQQLQSIESDCPSVMALP